MRVLHIGNIANNAYNIAKALRERTDIEADCYTNYYNHYISQPEWEDADISTIPEVNDYTPVRWQNVELNDFKRPDWYFETLQEALARLCHISWPDTLLRMRYFIQNNANRQRFDPETLINKFLFDAHASLKSHNIAPNYFHCSNRDTILTSSWKHYLTGIFQQLCVPPHRPLLDFSYNLEEQCFLEDIFSRYDIIQTYGAYELSYPILHTPTIPQITFEHGTMREFPFQDSPLGRRAMFAYKRAFANIITNADAIHNAKRMGLRNYVFIPHPVDDTKFRPKTDHEFRSSLLAEFDATHLFMAPARQNWGLKGNDKIIKAFAELIKHTGTGPKLLLGAWGQEIDKSKALIEHLKLDKHVVWLPPLPKRMLASYINACDAVLDQFILGAFGTTTPEAMACAKPVILFYNHADHEWCLPTPPPVINVKESAEIGTALLKLVDNHDWGSEIGRQSLEWFQEYHSINVVVDRHVELYKQVAREASVVYASSSKEEQKMQNLNILCFVDARTVDKNRIDDWLNGIQGQSALAILDGRIKQIHPRSRFLLALASDTPELEKEAVRLGWHTKVDTGQMRFFAPDAHDIPSDTLAATDFVYICDPGKPFIFEEEIDRCNVLKLNPDIITSSRTDTNPYIPSKIYSAAFIKYRSKLNDLFDGQFTAAQCESIMTRYGVSIAAPSIHKSMPRVTLDNYQLLFPSASPMELRQKDVASIQNPEETLKRALRSSTAPPGVNAELNTLETTENRTELNSFPTFVGLNLTSKCSAHCAFCSIQPKTQKIRDAFTLEEIKKMDWLRHVQTLAIWGGIGDSLVNPEFLPIVDYLHTTFPKLKLELSTNGILLNEDTCQTLASSLSSFNVSLNAATLITWEKLMRSKGFDNVCKGIRRIAQLRKNAYSPKISLSYVLTRENIHEVVQFVELAKNLGADKVTFGHYVPSTLVGRRDLPAEQSLYLDKELSDRLLSQAAQRAEALGISYSGPLPFSVPAEHVSFGARSSRPSPACTDPWHTCYLTVDEDGNRQMIFCCSSFYYNIRYDKTQLDEHNFRRIWNHPAAQYFRQTVNCKGANPICDYCNGVDRFNPENMQNYEINTKIQPLFAEIDACYHNGKHVTPEEICARVKDIFGVKNDD